MRTIPLGNFTKEMSMARPCCKLELKSNLLAGKTYFFVFSQPSTALVAEAKAVPKIRG